ncbi:MAG TPA: CvpA family protein [Gaiellaceae bacterium]
MTRADWIAVAIIVLAALGGLRRGLIGTVLSLAGLVAGAALGARVAPHLLSSGGHSPYTAVVALVGAVVGAGLLSAAFGVAASFARGGLRLLPPLRMLDSLGGLAAGAAIGVAFVWVLGAVLLDVPGQTTLRHDVQQSKILARLNRVAPPSSVLSALNRVDPLPSVTGPEPPTTPPNQGVLQSAGARNARGSVVRILATACGLGVEGSGWVVAQHEVVTAAHVIAGANGIKVDGHPAQALVVDRRQDVAILRVPALDARPLTMVEPQRGDGVAILGFPEDGPFDARAGRIGVTGDAIIDGSLREVTALSGLVRHGNSGGPAVNGAGQVEATIFAAKVGTTAGYGIPAHTIRLDLQKIRGPVSTGSC